MKVLFIAKSDNQEAVLASKYAKQVFSDIHIIFGKRGDTLPENVKWWRGDYILSYLSPWVIPEYLLERAGQGAINWHPGPPEYPGIGCTNFAIYNQEKEFGITCHYMTRRVDSGRIIEVKRFFVLEQDTVLSITNKCYAMILASFYSIIEKIAAKIPLPEAREDWRRKPYTRKELDELCQITPEMEEAEISRRINATTYDKPWAYTEIKGFKFFVK